MTSRVLITGGNGFVGCALATRLQQKSRQVRVSVRSAGTAPSLAEEAVVGDLSGPVDWSDALQGVHCVVHVAGLAHQLNRKAADDRDRFQRINVHATLSLAEQAARQGVRRLIFISSIGVNGVRTDGCAFQHDDTPDPTGPYAQSKVDAELGLAAIAVATGLEVVIIRPPLILGDGAKGNMEILYRAIRRGLPLPLASVTKNRRDLVSCDTLCDLIEVCIDHPAAAGQTFLVSDGHALSTRALIEAIGTEIGVRPRLVPVPVFLLRAMLKAAGRGRMASQLTEDLEVDIAHTRQCLNWHPPASISSATPGAAS
jgi:nucleoside-diphosphate-sugar epimerase